MIRQVTIRGFKRFGEVRFTFAGHVVLAGPNNAGKTTILQAITAWDLALRRWRSLNDAAKHRGAYTKAPLARQAFTAVPLRTFDLLWRDRQLEHPIEIEIQSQAGWTLVMELLPDTTEQVYVRPRKDQDPTLVPRDGLQAVFVPPMTGVVIDEPLYANPEFINLRLSQARPGEVLRNILVEASHQEEAWRALTASIERLFGYRLLPPDAHGAHILSEYQAGTDGLRFDLASAGSGFQQVVMLLSHLHTRPGAVLLLDEPDAHLHLILQEAIYSELRSVAARQRSQLVIATHSEVVINTVQPEEIYVVLGTPRRLADGVDRQRLVAALQLLSNAEVMLAESALGVLYVENFTDLGLLSEWARVLGHPARDRIAAAVHRFTGSGVRSTRHYDAIRLVREGLPGLELLDRDGNPNVPETEITGGGLQRLRWHRYEIESYLVHPGALARFVSVQAGTPPDAARAVVEEALHTLFTDLTPGFVASPLAPPPLVETYLRSTKARTEILPAVLSRAGLPEFPYTRYAEIAAVMRPEEIHPEVVEKLDAIVRAFGG